MKILTIDSDIQLIDYVEIYNQNPDIDVFITISQNLLRDKRCNINYVASLFYQYVKKNKLPVFIYVTSTTIYEQRILSSIIFTAYLQCNSSPYSGHEYTLIHYLTPLVEYNPIDYKLSSTLINDDFETVIFNLTSKGNQNIFSDDQLLGFYKAVPNPKYVPQPDCYNCHYHSNSLHLLCAVRPGYNQLCSDYVKFYG